MLVQGERAVPAEAHARAHAWPLATAVGVLVACGIAAVLVSDWFVEALEPAIAALGISQAFAGLVVVAIAGNAVENVVGIRFAAAGKADFAVSVVLNGALQVAVAADPDPDISLALPSAVPRLRWPSRRSSRSHCFFGAGGYGGDGRRTRRHG